MATVKHTPIRAVTGRRYRVPCVRIRPRTDCYPWDESRTRWMPILGPEHEDREIIGFQHDHWHVDWRFVSGAMLAWLDLDERDLASGECLGVAVVREQVREGPIMRRLVCRRAMPEFPSILKGRHSAFVRAIPWQQKLDAAFADSKLPPDCRTCPHRGVPLCGPVKKGVTVCPGHGLQWNLKTRRLVKRKPPKIPDFQVTMTVLK